MEFAREKAKEMEIDIDENMISHLGFLFNRDALVSYLDITNFLLKIYNSENS
jgi:hypothetical protein